MRGVGLDYGQAVVQFWVQCVQYVEEGLHINCKATVEEPDSLYWLLFLQDRQHAFL